MTSRSRTVRPPEDVLARVPEWSGRDVSWEPLSGGLSHEIYLVNAGHERAVLRILNPDIDRFLLGIPVEQEIENTIRAAETGVGAGVVASFPDVPAVVLAFIDGRTLDVESVRANAERVGRACRSLHDRARPFVNDFNIFRHLEGFLTLCQRHDLRIPDGYESYLPQVRRIEAALGERARGPVPCHNDLLAENLIDDGTDVRIVDYQLSGMNDLAFELGDVAAESDFNPDDVERLCEGYFGRRLPGQVARVRMFLIMSNFTWTLWFSIHKGLMEPNPDVEFDYWAEALDKWGQAVRDLESPEFGPLMTAARGAE